MKKSILSIILCALLCTLICGCSNNEKDVSSDSTTQSVTEVASSTSAEDDGNNDFFDDQAISIIEEGLEKRWGMIEDSPNKSTKNYINAELAVLNKYDFEKENFKDAELKQLLCSYVSYVEESKDTIDQDTGDSLVYEIDFDTTVVERYEILLKLQNDYGLTVSDQISHNLDEMPVIKKDTEKKLEKCKKLKDIVDKIDFECEDSKFGYTYTYILENNTDYEIKDLSLEVTFIDEEGLVAKTYYSNIQNVPSGEKGKLTFDA